MSLEQKIEELTGTVTALTAIMEKMTANQERLLAGQEKAIEAVKAGNPATATRGRKAKAEAAPEAEKTVTPNTSDEPAATESGEDAAETASEPAAPTEKKPLSFAEAAKKWLDNAEKGSDEYKARGAKIMGILGNFGAGKMSEIGADDEGKAMFYLKRTVKGLPVNFDAEYDFAGAVDQTEPEAATAAAEDDDDMFG